jgi:hypothetical protein
LPAGPLVVVAFLALTGCRSLSALEAPGATNSFSLVGPSAQEAPARCGFAPGTALSFAGRSTTAALDVEEVVGDPMSTQPADIYITRDAFDQGAHHGRLVCAIFVSDPEFVEITVHPSDGGRVSPTPELSVGPTPSDGISRDQAVAAARATVPDPDQWEISVVEAMTVGQLRRDGPLSAYKWAAALPSDLWVWRVMLWQGSRGLDIVVDFTDGTVYGTAEYIS